ncbi:MAG: ATP-binding protein, partial [Ferruginibacter sp.]
INDSIIYAACLNSGLYQLNSNTGAFKNITPPRNPADPTSLQPDIQKVSVTPDAGIFIGGNYYVYQQQPDYVRLKKNVIYPDDGHQLNIGLNSCLWDEKRQLYWLAASDGKGIYLLDKELKHIQSLPGKLPAEMNNYFFGLAADAYNRIWTLNYNNGIYVFNDLQKQFERPSGIIPLPDSILKNITRLKSTGDGNLWMLSGENFIYWNVKTNKTEWYPVTWSKDYKGLHDIRGNELAVDPDGNAWLFTKSGMFICNRNEKKVDHVFKTGAGVNDLASSIVLTGAFNKNNDLWITSGNGLQVINRKNYSVLSSHDVVGGLPSMLVRGICTDSSGRVWAALASGLGLFDPKTKAWQLFNRLDGLEKDYLDNIIFITSNNKIIINQSNGFLIKDINELMPQSKPPLLHITSILVNHEPYTDSLLPEFISNMELPYDKNNIDIEFAAMDWVYPFKTNYRYRIEGLPSVSTWNPSPEARISLTALPPGKFILHLQALTGNGIWSKEIIFPITIRLPFWKTWWFITACIILLVIFFYSLYRYRINRFIEMQKIRNSISRDLHDEIGATLSSVNMLSAVALKKAGAGNEASPIIQQIKNSVQQAGESMDDIVWSVNPANDSAQDTFARIRKYVTDLAEQNGINCIINIDEKNDAVRLPMELRRDIYLVCKEAVNNALKYSGCTELSVSVYIHNNTIEIKVADNGKGFDTKMLAHTQRNGIGNMKHRISKHKGIFTIVSEKDKGTAVDCRVPL